MAMNATDLSRIKDGIHRLAGDSGHRHTRQASFSVLVDGWDTANVVPWQGALGTVGTIKATLLSGGLDGGAPMRFTREEVSQMRFQFNKAFTQAHSVVGRKLKPFEGRAWQETGVQMSQDGSFSEVCRFVVSLPSFDDLPGAEDLASRATTRHAFEGGPKIMSVPVTMTVTAPKVIFPADVQLVYTSGREGDFTVLRSALQQRAVALVESARFQTFVAGMIAVNCLALAADQPSNEKAHKVLMLVEVVCSIFFSLEAAVAVYGLTWSVYWASNWHKLDLVVAVEGSWFVVAYFTGNEAVDISALRLLRILRPLRTVSHIPVLQEAVEVILTALPSIYNSVLLYFCFLVFAAVFMLQLAVHSLEYTCKGDDYDGLEQPTFCSPHPKAGCIPGLFVPFDCGGRPNLCTRATEDTVYPNFDNFGESLLSIFRISTLDGWAPALWHLQNAVGANVVFIFVILIVIGPCVVTNLCIAAVLKHYSLVSARNARKREEAEAIQKRLHLSSKKLDALAGLGSGGGGKPSSGMAQGTAQALHCPKCKAIYLSDADFCRKCGTPRIGEEEEDDDDDDYDYQGGGEGSQDDLSLSSTAFTDVGGAAGTSDPSKQWICTPPKYVVDWWFENVKCWVGGYGGLKNEKLRATAGDDFSVFNQCMNLVIVGNVLMMACESFGQPDHVRRSIQTTNVVFTVIFLVETVFKLVVLGPGEMLEYGRSAIAVIDLFVVIISTVSLAWSSNSSSSASVLRLLKLGRALRVLRMSRVSKRWHQVVQVVQLMQSSVSRVWPMLFLFLLFLFMSTIMAMQLFGDVERDGNFGFRTFGQSISMCFFVIALEDWGDVLEFANDGASNGPSVLFFVAIVLFGQLLLLNLVLATIVDGAVEVFEEAFVRQEVIGRVKRHLHRQSLHVAFVHFRRKTSRVPTKPRFCLIASQSATLPQLMCSCGCVLKQDSMFCRRCGNSRVGLAKAAEEYKKEEEALRAASGATSNDPPAMGAEEEEEEEDEETKRQGAVVHFKQMLLTDISVALKKTMSLSPTHVEGAEEGQQQQQQQQQQTEEEARVRVVYQWDVDSQSYVNVASAESAQQLVGFKFQAHEATQLASGTEFDGFRHFQNARTKWRSWCTALANFWAFKLWMDFILLFSILTLIVADDQVLPNGCLRRGGPWTLMDAATVFFFVVEMVARGGARGVWRGSDPLLRDPWMVLEIVINAGGVLHLGTALACAQSADATVFFRVLRSLRPLRFVHRNESLHRTFHSILVSVRGLSSVICLIMLFLFGFAIIGMQLWMGHFWACEDDDFPEGMHKDGSLVEGSTDEYDQPPCASWTNADFNYDNFPNAMMSSFTFLAGGWSSIWMSASNTYKVDHQPIEFNSFEYVPIFLFSIFVFDMYLKNLFIGIVFDSYLKIYHKEEGTGRILSAPERRFKHYSQSVLKGLRPMRPDPHLHARPQWLRDHVDSDLHANFILITLLINMLLLCVTTRAMPDWLHWVCDVGNTVVTFVFVGDFFAVVYAYGYRKYFTDPQFVFDFVVTVTSAVDTIMELSSGFDGKECPSLAVLRALRVLRLIKLLKHLPGVEVFLASVMSALPSIRDLTLLLFVFIVVAASMGSAIFRTRYEGGLAGGIYSTAWKKHSNFGSTTAAMVELFVLVTGDQWEGEMFEQKAASKVSGRADDSWQVFLFHALFQVLGQCLFLNLFIMVVVEAYEVLDDDKRALADACVQEYVAAWAKLDPEGTGFIAPKLLPTLLLLMQPPIGLQGQTSKLVIASHVHVLEGAHGLRYEFHWILKELLLLYVYDDRDSHERIDWSRNVVAMECCKASFKRNIAEVRKAKALALRARTETPLEWALGVVGLRKVEIEEDDEGTDSSDEDEGEGSDESAASQESQASMFSDVSDLLTCSKVDGVTKVMEEASASESAHLRSGGRGYYYPAGTRL